MKIKINIIALIALSFLWSISFAQDLQPVASSEDELNEALNIKTVLMSRTYKDSIILRWAVDKPAVWEIANSEGYRIERAELTNESTDYSGLKFEEIEGSPFKTWDEQQFTTYFETHDETSPEAESVYLVSILTGVFDQETDKAPKAFSAFQNNLNSLKEGKSNLDMKFGFSMLMANRSATAAVALGVRAVDRKVVNGTTYVYRMSLVGHSSIYKDEACYLKVKAEAFNSAKFKEEIYYLDGDKEVILSWNSSKEFSSYHIDRALSATGTYSRLTKIPIIKTKPAGYEGVERSGFKNDSLTNYIKYYYRVIGNSVFADEIIIGEIEVMPQDRTPPQKPFLELPLHKDNAVFIKWTMSAPVEGDLKGFLVARSDTYDGDFIRINELELRSDSREFIDKSYNKDKENYYIIQSYDTSFNISTSNTALVTLIDSTPPAKPVFISGKIDSLGIVTITVKKNREKDLMGYRVFKANEEEHEFSVIYEGFLDTDSLIQEEVQTVFIDSVTLNSLTPYIFYKVTALDFHFNQSDFSDALKVKRPDTIPPITPVFTNVLVSEKEVELYFALSESEDVVEHTLYRKTAMDAPWDSLVNIDIKQNSYIDKNVKQGTTYYYSLRAKDDSYLYSNYANAVSGKPYDNGVRPIVENISISKEKEKIILNWEYKEFNNNTFFVIYKKDGKGNLKEYQRADELKFVDSSVKKGTNSYAIKVFTKDGGQSRISKIIEYDEK